MPAARLLPLLLAAALALAAGARAQDRPAPQMPRPNETCLYPERNFAGTPECYRSTRLRVLDHVGPVGSVIPARRAYVYLCSRPGFRGKCRAITSRLGKRLLVPRIGNGSLILIPDARISVRERGRTLLLRPGRYWDLDAPVAVAGRPGTEADLTLIATSGGLALRPLNGARLYPEIDQWPASESTGRRVQSCMARVLAGAPGSAAPLVLGQGGRTRSLCLRSADGSWAILTLEPPAPGAAGLRARFYVARAR